MAVQWKVALVEDDHRLSRAVSAGLRGDGYRVRAAASAVAAGSSSRRTSHTSSIW